MPLLTDDNEKPPVSTSSMNGDSGIDPGKHIASSPEDVIDYLTEAEIRAILSTLTTEQNRLLFTVGFELGGRVSEVGTPTPRKDKEGRLAQKPNIRRPHALGLLWSRVHFKQGYIVIWDEKKDVDRVCHLSKSTWKLLRAYSNRSDVIESRKHDDRVFPLSCKTLERRLRQWAKDAGIERRVRWHMLRHSYVVHSIRAGRDWRVISQQTGDKVTTLMKVYSGLSIEDTQELIDKHPLLGGLV